MQFELVFQAFAPARVRFAWPCIASFTVISVMYEAMFNAVTLATHRLRSKPTAWKNLIVRCGESCGARASRSVRTAGRAGGYPERSRPATQNSLASYTA